MATEADMLSIFKPAAHKARLPAAEIDPLYRRLRWQQKI
jgi:OPA family glycerol-3-phosphate transporter-like MFS transporter